MLGFIHSALDFYCRQKPTPVDSLKKNVCNYLLLLKKIADSRTDIASQNEEKHSSNLEDTNASIVSLLERALLLSNDRAFIEKISEASLGLCHSFTTLGLAQYRSVIVFATTLTRKTLQFDETTEKFNHYLISVELLALKIFEHFDARTHETAMSDLLGELMQLFWGIHNADTKERLRNTMGKCAARQTWLLKQMTTQADSEQRLQRLSLLNELANLKK